MGECGFERSAARLGELVLGEQVRLGTSDEDRDRYDRLLRYVDVGRTDAGLTLIEEGSTLHVGAWLNDYLSGMFGAVGITLIDFKMEFGRVWENDFSRVILADEISPDSCRLWDTISGEKLDRFRRDLGNVIESYTEVARRLGIMKDMPTVIQGGLH